MRRQGTFTRTCFHFGVSHSLKWDWVFPRDMRPKKRTGDLACFVYLRIAKVYFKTKIMRQNIQTILIAGVPWSQALPGFLITAPPSVCVPDVIGVLAVWIQKQNKQKSICDHQCFVIRWGQERKNWCCGDGVPSILAFRREALPTLRYFPNDTELARAWPGWNCTTSYNVSVSVKKMGEGWTGGASDSVQAESSGEDPRATGGLVSNLPHPRVNKTKQHTLLKTGPNQGPSVLEDILGHQVGRREGTVCDKDMSVGVDDDAVVGVGVHGQGVNLDVGLGVGIVVGPPPPNFPRLLGSPSEIWESYDLNYHLSSWWGYPFNTYSLQRKRSSWESGSFVTTQVYLLLVLSYFILI